MRNLAYGAAVLIPALLTAALLVRPGEATSAATASPSARAAPSLVDYVPPSHVRVIPLYIVTSR